MIEECMTKSFLPSVNDFSVNCRSAFPLMYAMEHFVASAFISTLVVF